MSTYGGFDNFGRVVDQRWQNNTPAVLDQFKYGYDRASNRTWREVAPNGGNPTGFDEYYTYDGLHRLTRSQRGTLSGTPYDSISSPVKTQDFGLEALGNWKTFKEDDDATLDWDVLDQTRTHNAVNEVQTASGWVTPQHDAAGNMTLAPKPGDEAAAGGTRQRYTWDAWNRLVMVEAWKDANANGVQDDPGEPWVMVQEARYDGLNRRIFKIVRKVQGENVTYDRTDYYYNEGWQCLEERTGSHASLGEYPPSASGARGTVPTAVKVQWLWDIRYIDAPVLRWRDADSDENHTLEETLYYCNDANMNVTALVNASSGNVVERYLYDPYGKPTFLKADWTLQQVSGQPDGTASAYANEILYCGYRWNPESGVYDVRYRPYQPTLGRMVTWDPIRSPRGRNLYEYADSEPANAVDPLGLQAQGLAKLGSYLAAAGRLAWQNKEEIGKILIEEYTEDAAGFMKESIEGASENDIKQKIETWKQDPNYVTAIAHPPVFPTLGPGGQSPIYITPIMKNTPCPNARAYAAASMGDGIAYHSYAEWYYQQDWFSKLVIYHDTLGGPHLASAKKLITKGWDWVTYWIKQDVCCCRNSPLRLEIGTAIDKYNQLFWLHTPAPKRLPKYTAPKCFTETPGK